MTTPTSDSFGGASPDLGSPVYSGAFTITPGTALPFPTRAIWVGAAGNLAVTDMFGNTLTLENVPAGILPLRIASVASSGTTASEIVGLF